MMLKKVTVVSLALLAGTAGLLVAGPLNPPAGPVASTYKTLGEVEPRIAINATNTPGDGDSVFKIIGPGTYYLTSNVLGAYGEHGIEIAPTVSGTITIDLNGFHMVGGADSQSGISRTNAIPVRIVLKNGTISNWDGPGANLPNIDGGTFENVKFLNNFGSGLVTTRSRIINCEASSNTGHGMSVDDGSLLDGCVARLNTQHGVYADHDCTIQGSELSGNTQNGVMVEYQGFITNTNAAQNGNYGIYLPRDGSADGCMVTSNTGGGMSIQRGLACGCSATDNGNFGLSGAGTHFEDCISTDNNGTGIYLNGGSSAIHCQSTSNYSHGIDGGGGVQVIECKVQYNGGDGIRLALDGNTIRGNTCITNATSTDAAGIHMLTTDSVIEGNRVTGSDRGIDIDGAGNVITHNWCSGNTVNWSFVAGNYYGPIIDRTGAASSGVNSNAAAGTLTTADPHANISY